MKKIVFDKPPRVLDQRNLLLLIFYMLGIQIADGTKDIFVSFGVMTIMVAVVIFQYRDDQNAIRHYEEKLNELKKTSGHKKRK